MGFFSLKKHDQKSQEQQRIARSSAQTLQQPEVTEPNYSVATRRISCTACGQKQDVPVIAISAFCKKCGVRINLQDYKKSDFFRGDLETKGTLYITATGEVKGCVNVGDAVIDGKFDGTLTAEGVVKLMPGSQFYGEINSSKLHVADGATFIGFSNVKNEI